MLNAPVPNAASWRTQPDELQQLRDGRCLPRARSQVQEKEPGLKMLDWSMLGAAATLRVLDYTSTEKALTEPQYYHEADAAERAGEEQAGFCSL